MAYNNNRGGGYGNRQGGGYQNNRGGGGYRGGQRGGGNRGGGRGGDDFKYVRSSFFDKHLIFEAEKPADGPAPREKKDLEPGVTEEITITLSPQKTEQFLQKLQDAVNDQAGDGGVRMTMYCQHKINQQDNSEFDGASILVVAKFPPKNQNGYDGQKGGNGRRDYPDRNANSAGNQSSSRGQGNQSSATAQDRSSGGQGYTENSGW